MSDYDVIVIGRGSPGEHCAEAIPVDRRLRAAENVWVVGDATGLRMLTHVGRYQPRVVAENILGTYQEADYTAVARVVSTDPQPAAVGATDAPISVTIAAAGHPGDPHPHPARRAARHHPTVPTFSEIYVAALKALRK